VPRILTYNVHSCFGMDGGLSPQRIAKVIAPCQPDIVCLQELDVGRVRMRGIDQAYAIARELGMHVLFHAALRVMEEAYGNAVLTGRPAKLVKAATLPGLWHRSALEPRGALWVSVEIGGAQVQVITTHLGLSGPERLAQVEALLGPEWLGHADCRQPAILAGDFNAVPRSRAYQRLAARLRDAQSCVEGHRPQATYPSRVPRMRIDHVFVTDLVNVLRAESLRTPLARIASDHLPLAVDFTLQPPERPHHGRVARRGDARKKGNDRGVSRRGARRRGLKIEPSMSASVRAMFCVHAL
jgi:endonuclease/exonuclease/phosphatase family metal-dependent hydrolase